jgi:hypothetical protein
MKHNQRQYSPKQGRLPVYIADILDICDPVLTFDQIMEEIGIVPETRCQPMASGQAKVQSGQHVENGLVQLHGHRVRILEGNGK